MIYLFVKSKKWKNGGGVGIYISNRVNFRTTDDSNSEQCPCESLLLEILLKL